MSPYGTKIRHVRVKDDLWESAKAVADSRDENLADVIRAALESYIRKHSPKETR